MSRNLALVLVSSSLLALVACGGADSEHAQEPGTTAQPLTLEQGCQAFFTRARECTGPYIDALVGLRIELDTPSGIAAHAAAEGKPALVDLALTEWAEDSTPEAIAATCQRVAASVSPEQVEAMRADAERCMAMTDCDAFAACSVEVQRPRMAAAR